MKEHKISWLNLPGYIPETWNPIVGCSKVSPGCDNCYAEKMAFRISNMLEKSKSETYHAYKCVADKSGWTGRTALNTDHIDKPLQWKSPRMIFVCSMGDLFHENVPHEWLKQVFQIIYDNSQHIFVVLTKRPERMTNFFGLLKGGDVAINFPNLWLGVTAENQEQYNKRIPILIHIPAAKRFVSIEPMLGPIDISFIRNSSISGFTPLHSHPISSPNKPFIDWVICGGESGLKARPMHPDWVRSVRDQCEAAGTPFFFKQWGTWLPLRTSKFIEKLPWGDYRPEIKHGYVRYGKYMSGDTIDALQHHEWPTLTSSVAEKINL